MLYGEIRVILRENEVKTFHRRVERGRDRERGEWKGSHAKISRGREEGERGGVLWHRCGMKTAWKQQERGEEGEGRGRKQLLTSFLPADKKNCAVKNTEAAYVFGKVI